jgi:uncharacterized protein (TIGR03435 family)
MRNAILSVLILAAAAYAQQTPALTFEVATVKTMVPPEPGKPMFFGMRGGPGTNDPGQITWTGATLKMLLTAAYDVKPYQITGPDWLDGTRFDIIAKVPSGTAKDQVRVMWQNLLADRFALTLHHQSKVFQVEEMQIAKGGSKLKETTLDPNTPEAQPPVGPPGQAFGQAIVAGPGRSGGPADRGGPGGPPPPGLPPFGPPKMDKNGIPELSAPGLIMMMRVGPTGPSAHMVGKAQTIAQLAAMVGNELDRPVVDKTGLTGKYDFVLEFAPDSSRFRLPLGGGPGPAIQSQDGPGRGGPGPTPGGDANATDPAGLTIVGALQQQLGLRLVSTKAPLDILVIDHAEKTPTDN